MFTPVATANPTALLGGATCGGDHLLGGALAGGFTATSIGIGLLVALLIGVVVVGALMATKVIKLPSKPKSAAVHGAAHPALARRLAQAPTPVVGAAASPAAAWRV